MGDIKESVFAIRPDSLLYKTNMSLTLENLQKFVGGYIEIVNLGTYGDQEILMICNEEGKLLEKCTPNFYLGNDLIFGDVVFAARKGEEIVGINPTTITAFRTWLKVKGVSTWA